MLRDNFACVKCDIVGGQLQVDHIKPFAVILHENDIKTFEQAINCKELWDINNGRTLCVDCHKKTDTYGYGTQRLIQQYANIQPRA